MKKRIITAIILILSLSMQFLLAQNSNQSTTVGNSSKKSTAEKSTTSMSKTPQITHYAINGAVDPSQSGLDFYKNISISLVGENLTEDHFLTKEGLHWSNRTTVELIKGKELGILNDEAIFGAQNTPSVPVQAYRSEVGDSGRITFVGKTLSNIDLDLVWSVSGSDQEEWAKHSGYYNSQNVFGLGFSGEQFIPNATGNSIVVLYNHASNLALNYKIVKHNTMEEMPVVLSFISTDIDVAQGVQTNLANIVELIPKESNLEKKDGIIYDTDSTLSGLNGSKDLPKGGYLGAGFVSNFDYIFYSPAPERVQNSYYYPLAVRYDIFGSSLQANLITRLKNEITIEYLDEEGKVLKEKEIYSGFQDEQYQFESILIPKYKLINIKKEDADLNRPKIQFIYRPLYDITLKFVDEFGVPVAKDENYTVEKGYPLSYIAPSINDYHVPESFKTIVNQNLEYTFVYRKIEKPIIQHVEPSIPTTSSIQSSHGFRSRSVVRNYYTAQPTTTIQSSTPPKETATISEGVGESKDPFLENTKMTANEKKLFLDYIQAVAKRSREKHKDNQDKINHDIANAIAYYAYFNDDLQNLTNDFNEKPPELSGDIEDIFKKFHGNPNYIIDFPHLAMPLATSEKSVWWKEAIKNIAGFNLRGIPIEDSFFQLNSMTGDLLSHIDEKDRVANIDAYVLKYHPEFKDLSLEKRIEKYYHIENLSLKRNQYYQEVLEIKGKEKGLDGMDYQNYLLIGSVLTLGGAILVGQKLVKSYWKKFTDKINQFNEMYRETKFSIGKILLNVVVHPISTAITNIADSIKLKIQQTTVSLRNVVKPIQKGAVEAGKKNPSSLYKVGNIGKMAYEVVKKKVVQPVYQNVVQPAVKAVHQAVVKPVIKTVASVGKVAYQKGVKPVKEIINKKIIQPIQDFVKGFFKGR